MSTGRTTGARRLVLWGTVVVLLAFGFVAVQAVEVLVAATWVTMTEGRTLR